MGREKIGINENDLKKALREFKTQQEVADYFGVSQGTISNRVSEYDIGPKLFKNTERDKKLEMPNYTYEEAKEKLLDLEKKTSETVGYDEVEIYIDTDRPIGLIPVADLHVGARHVYYERFFKVADFILGNPYVYTNFNGDLIDNYNTSSYKGGQIDSQLKINDQKALAETIVKKLAPKALTILNGCHEEFSYFSDGFDFSQYLTDNKMGYYMGHNGLIKLTVGNVEYKIETTHKTYRNSTLNPGHGLGSAVKENEDFDIGISAHVHNPHFEQRVVRKKQRTLIVCGAFKGKDRYGSRGWFPPLLGTTPGIILFPDKKKVIGDINWENIMKYL